MKQDTPAGSLPADTVSAVQDALAAEYTLIWVYGLCTAFITGGADAARLNAGMTEHQARRDATQRLLTGAGAVPQTAAPAYVVPQPVTNTTSAATALALAESEATVAWRAVLEHTDDADLRKTALAALTDSAVRQTHWRRSSGQSPSSVAMPGLPG
ncbi:MAG TPA: ferritin-like domain-containing protein [Pseudonocardiaceae bacterium]|jgi:hypothetical protein|nr:ferritin-like domain-containing protein [Pseudonocardiaceae bacterium]